MKGTNGLNPILQSYSPLLPSQQSSAPPTSSPSQFPTTTITTTFLSNPNITTNVSTNQITYPGYFNTTDNIVPPHILFQPVYLTYLWLALIIGLPGNLLISAVYFTIKQKRTSDWFIFFLAVYDCAVCVFAVPLYLSIETGAWLSTGSNVACKLEQFIIHASQLSSVSILSIIAVDRFLKICHPTKRSLNARQARSIGLWTPVISGLAATPILVWEGNVDQRTCMVQDRYKDTWGVKTFVFLTFIFFVCMFFVVTYCYAKVIIVVKRRANRHKENTLKRKHLMEIPDFLRAISSVEETKKIHRKTHKSRRKFSLFSFSSSRRLSVISPWGRARLSLPNENSSDLKESHEMNEMEKKATRQSLTESKKLLDKALSAKSGLDTRSNNSEKDRRGMREERASSVGRRSRGSRHSSRTRLVATSSMGSVDKDGNSKALLQKEPSKNSIFISVNEVDDTSQDNLTLNAKTNSETDIKAISKTILVSKEESSLRGTKSKNSLVLNVNDILGGLSLEKEKPSRRRSHALGASDAYTQSWTQKHDALWSEQLKRAKSNPSAFIPRDASDEFKGLAVSKVSMVDPEISGFELSIPLTACSNKHRSDNHLHSASGAKHCIERKSNPNMSTSKSEEFCNIEIIGGREKVSGVEKPKKKSKKKSVHSICVEIQQTDNKDEKTSESFCDENIDNLPFLQQLNGGDNCVKSISNLNATNEDGSAHARRLQHPDGSTDSQLIMSDYNSTEFPFSGDLQFHHADAQDSSSSRLLSLPEALRISRHSCDNIEDHDTELTTFLQSNTRDGRHRKVSVPESGSTSKTKKLRKYFSFTTSSSNRKSSGGSSESRGLYSALKSIQASLKHKTCKANKQSHVGDVEMGERLTEKRKEKWRSGIYEDTMETEICDDGGDEDESEIKEENKSRSIRIGDSEAEKEEEKGKGEKEVDVNRETEALLESFRDVREISIHKQTTYNACEGLGTGADINNCASDSRWDESKLKSGTIPSGSFGGIYGDRSVIGIPSETNLDRMIEQSEVNTFHDSNHHSRQNQSRQQHQHHQQQHCHHQHHISPSLFDSLNRPRCPCEQFNTINSAESSVANSTDCILSDGFVGVKSTGTQFGLGGMAMFLLPNDCNDGICGSGSSVDGSGSSDKNGDAHSDISFANSHVDRRSDFIKRIGGDGVLVSDTSAVFDIDNHCSYHDHHNQNQNCYSYHHRYENDTNNESISLNSLPVSTNETDTDQTNVNQNTDPLAMVPVKYGKLNPQEINDRLSRHKIHGDEPEKQFGDAPLCHCNDQGVGQALNGKQWVGSGVQCNYESTRENNYRGIHYVNSHDQANRGAPNKCTRCLGKNKFANQSYPPSKCNNSKWNPFVLSNGALHTSDQSIQNEKFKRCRRHERHTQSFNQQDKAYNLPQDVCLSCESKLRNVGNQRINTSTEHFQMSKHKISALVRDVLAQEKEDGEDNNQHFTANLRIKLPIGKHHCDFSSLQNIPEYHLLHSIHNDRRTEFNQGLEANQLRRNFLHWASNTRDDNICLSYSGHHDLEFYIDLQKLIFKYSPTAAFPVISANVINAIRIPSHCTTTNDFSSPKIADDQISTGLIDQRSPSTHQPHFSTNATFQLDLNNYVFGESNLTGSESLTTSSTYNNISKPFIRSIFQHFLLMDTDSEFQDNSMESLDQTSKSEYFISVHNRLHSISLHDKSIERSNSWSIAFDNLLNGYHISTAVDDKFHNVQLPSSEQFVDQNRTMHNIISGIECFIHCSYLILPFLKSKTRRCAFFCDLIRENCMHMHELHDGTDRVHPFPLWCVKCFYSWRNYTKRHNPYSIKDVLWEVDLKGSVLSWGELFVQSKYPLSHCHSNTISRMFQSHYRVVMDDVIFGSNEWMWNPLTYIMVSLDAGRRFHEDLEVINNLELQHFNQVLNNVSGLFSNNSVIKVVQSLLNSQISISEDCYVDKSEKGNTLRNNENCERFTFQHILGDKSTLVNSRDNSGIFGEVAAECKGELKNEVKVRNLTKYDIEKERLRNVSEGGEQIAHTINSHTGKNNQVTGNDKVTKTTPFFNTSDICNISIERESSKANGSLDTAIVPDVPSSYPLGEIVYSSVHKSVHDNQSSPLSPCNEVKNINFSNTCRLNIPNNTAIPISSDNPQSNLEPFGNEQNMKTQHIKNSQEIQNYCKTTSSLLLPPGTWRIETDTPSQSLITDEKMPNSSIVCDARNNAQSKIVPVLSVSHMDCNNIPEQKNMNNDFPRTEDDHLLTIGKNKKRANSWSVSPKSSHGHLSPMDKIHSSLLGCLPSINIGASAEKRSLPSLNVPRANEDTCQIFARSVIGAFFSSGKSSCASDPCLQFNDDDDFDGIKVTTPSTEEIIEALKRSEECINHPSLGDNLRVGDKGDDIGAFPNRRHSSFQTYCKTIGRFGRLARRANGRITHSWYSLDDLQDNCPSKIPSRSVTKLAYLATIGSQIQEAFSLKNVKRVFSTNLFKSLSRQLDHDHAPGTKRPWFGGHGQDQSQAQRESPITCNHIDVIITRCESIVMDGSQVSLDRTYSLGGNFDSYHAVEDHQTDVHTSNESSATNTTILNHNNMTHQMRPSHSFASGVDSPNSSLSRSDDQSFLSRSHDTSIDRLRGISLDLLSPMSASVRGSVCSGLSSLSKATECSAYTENSRSDCEKITRRSAEREHNITKLLGVITLIFVVSWSVSWSVNLMHLAVAITDTPTNHVILSLGQNMFLMNHFCNIFFYTFFSKSFREKLTQFYNERSKKCLQQDNPSLTSRSIRN